MTLLDKLPEDAIRVKNTMNWIDTKGNVYGIETRKIKNRFSKEPIKHKNYGKYFKYNMFTNNHNGYVYCTFKYIKNKEKEEYYNKQRRVHIIVAETFLENPNNFPIVGHKNNIKSDNRVENLYWTTCQENTQKAVNDGLLVNDKSYDDSQSNPVIMFDTYTNKELGRYGSCREASRETGIGINTITRQVKYKRPVRKPYYFRFQNDVSIEPPTIVVQYDLKTHKEIGRYFNTWEAERKTGISSKTIQVQCKENRIPNHSKSGTYFLYKQQ